MPQQEKKLPDTADMNLATFIKVIKGIDTAGHHYIGEQLRINFNLTTQQMADYTEEYLNSQYAVYDATRRNFLRLLKRAR